MTTGRVVTDRPALRLATRGSRWPCGRPGGWPPCWNGTGVDASLVIVETAGDRHLDVSIDRLGGQGVFVKEVQRACPRGRRCCRALGQGPARVARGRCLRTGPGRVPRAGRPPGRPGRRGACLPCPPGPWWPPVRPGAGPSWPVSAPTSPSPACGGTWPGGWPASGSGGTDAVVAAKAAIDRLGWAAPAGVETEVLPVGTCSPRSAKAPWPWSAGPTTGTTLSALAAIDDPAVAPWWPAERAFLAELGGGCTQPVGAHAVWAGGGTPDRPGQLPAEIRLDAVMASGDGWIVLRHQATGTDPEGLGRAVARYLLDEAGGHDLGDWSPDPGVIPPEGAPVPP